MNPRIELIYSPHCPNVEFARGRIVEALKIVGRAPSWVEWNRESPVAPEHARLYGSPTILVDGRDVVGAPASLVDNCRVYASGSGFDRAPPLQVLLDALGG